MDLKQLLKQRPFACFYTGIGRLCAFRSTMKHQDDLDKHLSQNSTEDVAIGYVRALSRLICYPFDQLLEGEFKPQDAILTKENVAKLTASELESLAEAYIQNNEYLYRESSFAKKHVDGKEVSVQKYGKIIHPKRNDESAILYLHRLACLERKKQRDDIQKMFSNISGISGLPRSFADSIKDSFSAGETLRKSIERLQSPSTFTNDPIRMPAIDFAAMEEHRLKPFNELSDRLDQLIDSSAQTSEFLIEANRIHTEIAAQIKSTGVATESYSKKNINLSYVVIFISAASLVYAVYAATTSTNVASAQIEALTLISSSLESSLSQISQRSTEQQAGLTTLISTISDRLSGQDSRDEELAAQNQIIIDELREMNSSQQALIQLLRDLQETSRNVDEVGSPNNPIQSD